MGIPPVTAPILADALGPRARRRMVMLSVAATVALLALVGVAVNRLADKGQLDAAKWEPFTQWPVWRFLLIGLRTTMSAALVAMVLAVASGVILALGKLSLTPPIRWAATAWIEFFRGFPVLLLILFSFNGLPKLGVDLSRFSYLVLALVLYNGAVLGEIFRAGILSLDYGQREAAFALGLRYWSAMRLVLIPQAMRRMVPAIVSQLITLLKDTSLGFVVGFEELLRRGRINGEFGGNVLQSYVVVALMFIAVNFTLSRIARRLEVRQRRRLSAGSINVAGIEDLAAVSGRPA